MSIQFNYDEVIEKEIDIIKTEIKKLDKQEVEELEDELKTETDLGNVSLALNEDFKKLLE